MTAKDLLAELEIAPEATTDDGDWADEGMGAAAPTAPASPTALDLDKWSLRRGAEAIGGDVLGPILGDRAEAEHIAADCLAAAFEPEPRLAENCANETQARYFRQLLETEEYQALHRETRLDAFASELAAGHFAQGLIALSEKEPPPDTPADAPRRPGETGEPDPAAELKKDIRALGEAAKALDEATEEISELRDAQRSLGGDGAVEGQRVPVAELKARFQRIKNSRQLRRIVELAGKYRRMAQAKQRQKTLHGRDDMVGVELGADLERLLPSELAALADEDLELDAMRRYLERGLMQRDYRGVEPQGKGPIVVIVDESGSMHGEPIAAAKAFALAMGWVARHQKRWVCLVGFSGNCKCNCLAMPPGKWNQSAMLDWLEHFYSGGSYRDVPLEELPEVWPSLGCPAGQTDIIQITDAYCHVDGDLAARFNAWKVTQRAKYLTILIGNTDAGDLAKVADRLWTLPNLDIEHGAIQELMAI